MAAGRTQVILTTHSPYLLDLADLADLASSSPATGGPPRFDRPGAHEEVRALAERFDPGRLYTMGTLNRRPEGT
ncbi:MAG: hypothetical protein U0359_21610 [Byssovorax sp.]